MKKEKMNYTEEFKEQILALHNNGKGIGKIIDEYNLEISTVYKWVTDFYKTHEVNTDLKKFIPNYVDWEEGNNNFSSLDYLPIIASTEQILTTSKLLFPDIFLWEGCFFLKDYPDRWQHIDEGWTGEGRLADLERSMNFVSVTDMFGHNFVFGPPDGLVLECDPYIKDLQCREIVSIMRMSWSLYFNSKFPEYDLIIDVYNDNDDGWCITVYQKDSFTKKKPPLSSILKAKEKLVKK